MRSGNNWKAERMARERMTKRKIRKTGIRVRDRVTKSANFEFPWLTHLMENEMI